MLPKPIAHWILGHVSRATLHWIIGGLMLIPMAVVPIIIAVALFIGLLKVRSIRKVGIVNLIAASGVTLFTLPTAVFDRGAFPWLAFSVAATFAICWLICAITLFSRRRLAWCGSIVGAGVLVCFLTAALSAAIASVIYPAEHVLTPGPFLPGYVFGLVLVFTWLCLALAVSLWLLLGLLRIRRDIFSDGTTMPNQTQQPSATGP